MRQIYKIRRTKKNLYNRYVEYIFIHNGTHNSGVGKKWDRFSTFQTPLMYRKTSGEATLEVYLKIVSSQSSVRLSARILQYFGPV